MDPQLAAQLKQVISYALTSATADIYGQTQVGSTATVFARVEPRVREVENDNGTFERTSHMIVVDAVTGFTPDLGTRVWLPNPRTTAAVAATGAISLELFNFGNGDTIYLVETSGTTYTFTVTSADTADSFASTVNASAIAITAVAQEQGLYPGNNDLVSLTQDVGGAGGNTTISITTSNTAQYLITNFYGGVSASPVSTDFRMPKVVHPCFGERGTLEHWEILI